jgi:hypothetical protein
MGAPKKYPAGRPFVVEGRSRAGAGVWRELDRAATPEEAAELFEGAPREHPGCAEFRITHLGEVINFAGLGT